MHQMHHFVGYKSPSIASGNYSAQRVADVVDLSAAMVSGRAIVHSRMFATTSGPFISETMTVTRTWGTVPRNSADWLGVYQATQNIGDAYGY